MYVPEHFQPADLKQIHEAIEAYPFAALISTTTLDLPPAVTHLPLLLDRDRGPRGTLVGHLARANPHAGLLGRKRPTVAVFSGPHGYISAGWYRQEPSLPTWNYIAVHAAGTPAIIDDTGHLMQLLDRTVQTFERRAGTTPPWELRSDNEWVAQYRRYIVAFELPLDNLEAMFKLSQNIDEPLHSRVVAGLNRRGSANDRELIDYMTQ